jgi:hypothetical protein
MFFATLLYAIALPCAGFRHFHLSMAQAASAPAAEHAFPALFRHFRCAEVLLFCRRFRRPTFADYVSPPILRHAIAFDIIITLPRLIDFH